MTKSKSTMDEPGYVSRADSSVYLKDNKMTKNEMKQKLFNYFKGHSLELLRDEHVPEVMECLDIPEEQEKQFDKIFDEIFEEFSKKVETLSLYE